MEEVKILIDFIKNKYNEINEIWLNDDKYYPLNMKVNKVDHIYKNEKLLLYVFNYRNFINENATNIMDSIQGLELINVVNARVKALNSIQDKIEKYELKPEKGKIPIKNV